MALGFPWRLNVNRLYANALLKTLGIRCHIHGNLPKTSSLLVSNHVSWLDPFLCAQLGKVSFVTSTDTLRDPLLGSITRFAGCQFVSRKALDVQRELEAMKRSHSAGIHLAIYPEGTSGNGVNLLPFRSSFFEVAMQRNMPVQPIALRWNKEVAHYYGDMSFGPHLAQIVASQGLEATIEFLPLLYPQDFADRKGICAASAKSIANSNTIKTRFEPYPNIDTLDCIHAT